MGGKRTLPANCASGRVNDLSRADTEVFVPAYPATLGQLASRALQSELIRHSRVAAHFFPADVRWDRHSQCTGHRSRGQSEPSRALKFAPNGICQALSKPIVSSRNDFDRHGIV
jgi:hypothetical protein